MSVISVQNLEKFYRVHKKESGLKGSFKALFSRQYEDVKAVKGVSFTVEKGEFVGFLGPNGAGKTTTLKMLSGLLFPTGGKVEVLGFTPQERKEEFLKQISFVMGQKNMLWWDLPPIETFALNKAIYEVSDSDYKKVLDELIELFGIQDILHQPVRQLSLGQRMQCELISSLLYMPKVLFLDEPTIGLDVVAQQKVRDFIYDYNRKYNSTILLTSHNMDDVVNLARRVIVIDEFAVMTTYIVER